MGGPTIHDRGTPLALGEETLAMPVLPEVSPLSGAKALVLPSAPGSGALVPGNAPENAPTGLNAKRKCLADRLNMVLCGNLEEAQAIARDVVSVFSNIGSPGSLIQNISSLISGEPIPAAAENQDSVFSLPSRQHDTAVESFSAVIIPDVDKDRKGNLFGGRDEGVLGNGYMDAIQHPNGKGEQSEQIKQEVLARLNLSPTRLNAEDISLLELVLTTNGVPSPIVDRLRQVLESRHELERRDSRA